MSSSRKEAIEIIIKNAKDGNFDALQDLITLLKPIDNPQTILAEIYLSNNVSDVHREYILCQEHIFSKDILSRQVLSNSSRQGDINALNDLIFLMLKCDLEDRLWAAKVLRDIFVSKSSTPEQKQIIWSQKDTVIDVRVVEHKEYHSAEQVFDYSSHEYEWIPARWDVYQEEIRVTLYEYIKPDLLDL